MPADYGLFLVNASIEQMFYVLRDVDDSLKKMYATIDSHDINPDDGSIDGTGERLSGVWCELHFY